MKNKPYKLFIWRGIRTDFTSGIAFAVARDVEEARNAIKKTCLADDKRKWEWDNYKGELMNDPEVKSLPAGDWIGGGQ